MNQPLSMSSVVFQPLQERFLSIPQTPVCYWLRERFFDLLAGITLGDVADVCQGLATANDPRFVRFVWESLIEEWARPVRNRRWVPFEKGGGYGKWFGHHFWVVDWEHDGARIKATPSPRVQNEQQYFKEGWTYSYMARGSYGLRCLETGNVFAHISSAVIPRTEEKALASRLNARISSFLVRALAARIQLTESYIWRLPLADGALKNLPDIQEACVALKRRLVAHDVVERTFTGSPLGNTVFGDSSRLGCGEAEAIAAILHTIEGVSERLVFAVYDVAGKDLQAVLDETGTPAGWFPMIRGYDALPPLTPTLSLNGEGDWRQGLLPDDDGRLCIKPADLDALKLRLRTLYEAGPGAKEETDDTVADTETGEDEENEQIAVGARIPIPAETFLEELSQKIEIHPISVYWLLKEGTEKEGWRCWPEEQRLTKDRFTVLILRLLGHRWPKQIEALPAPRPDSFYVYVIECDNDSHYIGQTSDLSGRWEEHIKGSVEWTRVHKPVRIVHHEEYKTREEAVKRESDLKTGFGRQWLKKLIASGRARQAGGEPVPDWADDNGIIPLTEGTDKTTLYQRLRERLAVDFGDERVSSEENAFEEVMGKFLSEWVRNHFFRHHISQFKKRPIAWHLTSARWTSRPREEAAFECLVYYHKTDGDLLPKIRSHYVGPLMKRLDLELHGLENGNSGGLTGEQVSRKDLLRYQIQELKAFDGILSEVIVTGFGPESMKSQLRQYAVNDAMLCLKARWLKKLSGVIEADPLTDWEQKADQTGLHADFAIWISNAMTRLDHHCPAVGPKPPVEKMLDADPTSKELAKMICTDAESMLADALKCVCRVWWKTFDAVILKPISEKIRDAKKEQQSLKERSLDPMADFKEQSDMKRKISALKFDIKAWQQELALKSGLGKAVRDVIESWLCPEALPAAASAQAGLTWETWLADQEMYDQLSSLNGKRLPPQTVAEFIRQESLYQPDTNDGVRVNIAPLQKAGLLTVDVLAGKDLGKAIADRAAWRDDERRWCREGKLPEPGWWGIKNN